MHQKRQSSGALILEPEGRRLDQNAITPGPARGGLGSLGTVRSGKFSKVPRLIAVCVALSWIRITQDLWHGPISNTIQSDLPTLIISPRNLSNSTIVRSNTAEGDFQDWKQEENRSEGDNISIQNGSSLDEDLLPRKKFRGEFDSVAVPRNSTVEGGSHRNGRTGKGDDRPWLIIHVGPMKTATSTLQSGLEANAARLLSDDDLYYLGLGNLNTNLEPTPINTTDGKSVTIYRYQEIMEKHFFSKVLEEHQKLGKDVIISMEQFSNERPAWNDFFQNTLRHREPNRTRPKRMKNYRRIDDFTDSEEPLFQFRVKIVVTYRHFFEWLPSLFHESFSWLSDKFDPTLRIPGIVEYTKSWLDRLEQYDPENNRTTIYTSANIILRDQKRTKISTKTSHGSVESFLMWTSQPELYDRVDIFDLHQQPIASRTRSQGGDSKNNDAPNDVFANFLCQMVPTASKTCRHVVKSATKVIHERSRSPKGILSLPLNEICRIEAQARRTPRLNTTVLYKNRAHHSSRIPEWYNKQETEKKLGLKQCLDSELTRRLKVASWNSLVQMVLLSRSHIMSRKQRDEKYYLSLFQSPTPTDHLLLSSQYNHDHSDDDSWILPTKAAHDEWFDKFVGEGKFCQLDIETLMKDEDFIRYVFAPSPTNATNNATTTS